MTAMTHWMSALVTSCAALFATAWAQGDAPAPAPATQEPAAAAAPRESVRAAWARLSPEERAEIERAWGRWKGLGGEERAVMKRRHERLERARSRAKELHADEPARALSRRETNRRALADLRETWDNLPRELRRRVDGEVRVLPLAQREQRLKRALADGFELALRDQLRLPLERGELREEEVAALARAVREAPHERIALMRQFIVDHPKAFRIAPEMAESLRNEQDPGRGLRLLEKLRRRRPPPPPPGEPPRWRGENGGLNRPGGGG